MIPFRPPASWRVTASPNHNSRGTHTVSAIVLHADAAAKVDGTLDWCRKSQAQLDQLWEETPAARRPASRYRAVSYHVVVGRNGVVFQLVHPDRRAWHAGASELDGVTDVNSIAVGVCLSNNNKGEPYPISQRSAAADVCALLASFYRLPVSRIVTHAAIAVPAGRKTDPHGLDLEEFRGMVASRLAAQLSAEHRPPTPPRAA